MEKFVVTFATAFTVEVPSGLRGNELEVAVAEATRRLLAETSAKRIRNTDEFAFYRAGEVESLTINAVTVETR